jgi:hypothetical protein
MSMFFAFVALLSASCASKEYTQGLFAEDYASTTCELYELCEVLTITYGYETLGDCVLELETSLEPEGNGCKGYKSDAAIDCIEDVSVMGCDDLFAGTWPESCSQACSDGSAESPVNESDE